MTTIVTSKGADDYDVGYHDGYLNASKRALAYITQVAQRPDIRSDLPDHLKAFLAQGWHPLPTTTENPPDPPHKDQYT